MYHHPQKIDLLDGPEHWPWISAPIFINMEEQSLRMQDDGELQPNEFLVRFADASSYADCPKQDCPCRMAVLVYQGKPQWDWIVRYEKDGEVLSTAVVPDPDVEALHDEDHEAFHQTFHDEEFLRHTPLHDGDRRMFSLSLEESDDEDDDPAPFIQTAFAFAIWKDGIGENYKFVRPISYQCPEERFYFRRNINN